MKVGDLVALSAYGKKVKRTGWVYDEDVGVVKAIGGTAYWNYYIVFWSRSGSISRAYESRDYPTRGARWDWEPRLDRRDLKFVK